MGGVGFEDVAVAGFQLFDYTGLIDRSGTDIVSQRTEKNRVFAILRIHGAELLQIFTQESIGFTLGQWTMLWKPLSGQDSMTISVVRSVFQLMKSLKFLDYQDCTLKKWQFHYRPLGGEGWRSDREGH